MKSFHKYFIILAILKLNTLEIHGNLESVGQVPILHDLNDAFIAINNTWMKVNGNKIQYFDIFHELENFISNHTYRNYSNYEQLNYFYLKDSQFLMMMPEFRKIDEMYANVNYTIKLYQATKQNYEPDVEYWSDLYHNMYNLLRKHQVLTQEADMFSTIINVRIFFC